MSISIPQAIVSIVGTCTNSLLIYCAIFHTPKVVKTYSTIILIHSISDLCSCLLIIPSKARTIIVGWKFIFPSNGYCKYYGATACGLGYAIISQFYSFSLYLIMISFLYRFLVLKKVNLNVKHLVTICFFFFIPCVLQTIFIQYATVSGDYLYDIVHAKHPTYNLSGYVFNGVLDFTTPQSLIGFGHILTSPTPIYLTIMFLRRNIVKKLEEATEHMSKNTKQMHSQLLKSLIVQSMLPQINILGFICVCVEIFNIYADEWLEEGVNVFMGLIPLSTPVVSLYFIKPYNIQVRRMLRMQVGVEDSGGYSASDRKSVIARPNEKI